MFGLSVPVIAGLLVLAILFAMAGFANAFAKSRAARSAHRLRNTRSKNGNQWRHDSHSNVGAVPRALAGVDVILTWLRTEPLQQPGRRRHGRGGAQLKVKSDPVSIRTAAEQFLHQAAGAARRLDPASHGRAPARHHRAAHGGADREGAEMVGDRMRSRCAADMNKMGLDVVSFTLKESATRTSTSPTWAGRTSHASSAMRK